MIIEEKENIKNGLELNIQFQNQNLNSIGNVKKLKKFSFNVREHILRLSAMGGCYIGSALSLVEITTYLYNNYLNINPENFDNPERDYLFLSKGHSVPVLYSTFVELGWMPEKRLDNHLKISDDIYWHPNINIPGIEFPSGSLGHSLSVAVGVAIDSKLKNQPNKIFVIMGDGELNEGSVWEGLLTASAYKLDNLIIIIDRNKLQANTQTENLIPLEPLADKFTSFGCAVQRINGHDFNEISNSLNNIPFHKNKPSVIIADTVRGKGIPSIENRADRWYANFTITDYETLINELYFSQNPD